MVCFIRFPYCSYSQVDRYLSPVSGIIVTIILPSFSGLDATCTDYHKILLLENFHSGTFKVPLSNSDLGRNRNLPASEWKVLNKKHCTSRNFKRELFH